MKVVKLKFSPANTCMINFSADYLNLFCVYVQIGFFIWVLSVGWKVLFSNDTTQQNYTRIMQGFNISEIGVLKTKETKAVNYIWEQSSLDRESRASAIVPVPIFPESNFLYLVVTTLASDRCRSTNATNVTEVRNCMVLMLITWTFTNPAKTRRFWLCSNRVTINLLSVNVLHNLDNGHTFKRRFHMSEETTVIKTPLGDCPPHKVNQDHTVRGPRCEWRPCKPSEPALIVGQLYYLHF